MSEECKHCKYFKTPVIGLVLTPGCLHPKNRWDKSNRAIVSYKFINMYDDCDWYKPRIRKRLQDQWVRIKKKLNYIILSARRRFRP